jgi:hypothetical protein
MYDGAQMVDVEIGLHRPCKNILLSNTVFMFINHEVYKYIRVKYWVIVLASEDNTMTTQIYSNCRVRISK